MAHFKQLKYFPVLYIAIAITFCCKKKQPEPDTIMGTEKLEIIKNTALANATDALQAVYSSGDRKMKGYYYGTFNANGEPDSIKKMVISKTAGDTSLNITLDDKMRATSLYLSHASAADTTLLTFDYSIVNQVMVRVHYYNFTTNATRLKYEYTVDYSTSTYNLISQKNYASFGGGLLDILLNINLTTSTETKYDSQLTIAQGKLIGLVAALSVVAGTTATAITLTPAIGVAVGLYTAYSILKPTFAGASEITSSPNSPDSPKKSGHKIGEFFGGGIIISIDNTGQHGLIASVIDQNLGTTWNNALSVAASFTSNGFTGWRLPTYNEMQTLYRFRGVLGNFSTGCNDSNFGQCTYWTSTQNGSSFAWAMYFTTGNFWSNYATSASAKVRAIRSF